MSCLLKSVGNRRSYAFLKLVKWSIFYPRSDAYMTITHLDQLVVHHPHISNFFSLLLRVFSYFELRLDQFVAGNRSFESEMGDMHFVDFQIILLFPNDKRH